LVTALAIFAGSASGAISSKSGANKFDDPFTDPDGFKPDPAELPILGDEDGLPGPGPDYRAHSDVPDLPDSTDDPDSESNALFLGDPDPTPAWYPQDPELGFETAFADLDTVSGRELPVIAPSAVPAPGGIGVLTLLAITAAARRRR
jgi:hypothetical protein